MNLLKFKFVFLIGIALIFTSLALSQQVSVLLKVKYLDTDSVDLYFGFDKSANFCVLGTTDTLLGEAELPPLPFEGFDVRFQNPRDEDPNAECFGQGTAKDYRTWNTTSVVDTFRITMKSPGSSNFSWSWPSGLSQYFDALILKDAIFGFISFDMLAQTSASTQYTINLWNIIATPKVNDVSDQNKSNPIEFALNHNYPNPFNPTTTVTFDIEKTVNADIAIYDILGRKVKTLVAGKLNSGHYTTGWNGVDDHGFTVGSGVYYIKMFASSEETPNQIVFSSVRKLLLLK